MDEKETTDSLTILGVLPDKLHPKPGSPENQIFEYTRKKQKVWVELPGQPQQQPKENTTPIPEAIPDEISTPIVRKRGRPRKIQTADPIEPISNELKKKKSSIDKTNNATEDKEVKDTKSPTIKEKVLKSPPKLPEPVIVDSEPVVFSSGKFPKDPKGELKINPDGTLNGGREFNIPIFKVPSRPNSYFMLAAPLYRRLGFNDRRQLERGWPDLPIVDLTMADREFLNESGFLRILLRGFRVCVVPARDAFVFFGHVIIKNGVSIIDDYFENPKVFLRREIVPRAATTVGTVASTTPATAQGSDDSDISLSDDEQKVTDIYFNDKGDSREDPDFLRLPLASWMSKSAQAFNSRLSNFRKSNVNYYDPHTNLTLRPKPRIIQDDAVHHIDDSLVELLPPDIQENIKTLKNQHKHEFSHSQFPLALTDKQFQSTIPLHSTRFGHKLNIGDINFLEKIRYTEQPIPTPATSVENYNLNFNIQTPQTLKNSPSRTNSGSLDNSRENSTFSTQSPLSRITCGFPRAGTNVPCAVPVSESGKLCHFHKNSNAEPASSTADASDASDPEANLCVFCNATSAPSTALDANGGVKLKPNDNQRKKVSRTDTVSCAECHKVNHLWCIQITDHDTMECMRSYKWVCNDCKFCSVCESPDDEETLLFCDGCDRAQHMACCKPPILELPKGGWKCQICA